MALKIWTGAVDGNAGTAGNWTGGTPVNGDDVFIGNSNAVSINAGLDQSAVNLASLTIDQSYSGTIGTTTAYLKYNYVTTVKIGENYGTSTPSGSQRIKLWFLDNTNVIVYNTSFSSLDAGLPPLRLIFVASSGSGNHVYVKNGYLGVAMEPGEASVVPLVDIARTAVNCNVQIGSGTTFTTLTKYAGDVVLRCAVTTITQDAGSILTEGSGAITTITNNGGTFITNSTGTITTFNGIGGTLDASLSDIARTITTLNIYRDFNLRYDPAVTTITNRVVSESLNLSTRAL